jgi:predicted ATP-grasp superfamily ATP-dependent carboligase
MTSTSGESNEEAWVLLSEGGNGESRAAVTAVRALAHAGYRTSVTETDRLSLAGASRWCDRRVPVAPVEVDAAAYANAIRAELSTRPYLTSFFTTDAALLALDAPVRHLLDKASSGELARAAGLQPPPTEVFDTTEELRGAASRLRYPIVVKPALKLSSAEVVENASELASAIGAYQGRVLVQPRIEEPFFGFGGLMYHGRLVAAMRTRYVRLWPQPCGTVATAETLPPDPALEERVVELLRGYEGPFHLDFVGPYLLDVNPRIHATLPLAIRGGANIVAMYCDLLRGRAVSDVRVAAGLRFRWVEGDLRSLLWGVRRGRLDVGEALAALAPRRGTVHSFASYSDPGPSVARARYLLRRVSGGRTRASSSAARRTSSSTGDETSR